MKKYIINTMAATIFFLLIWFSSLSAAGSTSPQGQQVVPLPKAAGNSGEMVSRENLPVFSLPEVICTAKKTPRPLKALFDKKMKVGIALIEMPKIRMIDFSKIVNEFLVRLR